jgi:hypothetical protein
MARRKKKLKPTDLARQGGLELPNREAMSLIQPGLGLVDMGLTQQPGLGGPNPPDGGTGAPSDPAATPSDPAATPGATDTALTSKATRIVGPLPLT